MIILDTSIWIEHLRNNQLYFPNGGAKMPDTQNKPRSGVGGG